MTTTHLVILLVRFLAVCLGIYAIGQVVYSGLLFAEPNSLSIAAVALPASTILVSILIWFMPYSTARVLSGFKGGIEAESKSMSADEFAAITFLVLALYLAYQIVSDTAFWLYYYLNYQAHGLNELGLDASASIFSTLLELIFFVMMVLGRKKIFYYFRKLRT